MLPRQLAQLAFSLRPALLAAHQALQPGPVSLNEAVQVSHALALLRKADDELAAFLRGVGGLLGQQSLTEAEMLDISSNVDARMRGLIGAYRTCQLLRAGGELSGIILADIARDTLVIYAHFLADLIFAMADPFTAIRESEAARVGDDRFEINVTCSTQLPETLDELAHWTSGRFSYDEARCRRVLRLAETQIVAAPPEPCLPPPSLPSPPTKPLSFWGILGLGALLSLLFGHDHCNDGD